MLDNKEHKKFLIKVLKDIYTDNTLGPILGFKGGTAALFFYGLDRFSVDLDFDLLDPEKEDYVFEKVLEIVSRYGDIRHSKKKYYTLFCELSYSKGHRHLNLEINRRSFGSQYRVMNYLGIAMKVMTREDMFANKLAALYERMERAKRDIYDVWFFMENAWPLNKELLEKRVGLSLKECLESCIERLEKMADNSILSGMGEVLSISQKNWAKAKLKSETLFLLRLMLEGEKDDKLTESKV